MTDCRTFTAPPRRPPPITIAAALTGLVASIGEMVAGPARAVAENELESIAIKIRALATKVNGTRRKAIQK
ncbi:MAG: hypothetical protein ABSC25_16300 [Roseiarcus sp.]|jgi:hypothetical protein